MSLFKFLKSPTKKRLEKTEERIENLYNCIHELDGDRRDYLNALAVACGASDYLYVRHYPWNDHKFVKSKQVNGKDYHELAQDLASEGFRVGHTMKNGNEMWIKE